MNVTNLWDGQYKATTLQRQTYGKLVESRQGVERVSVLLPATKRGALSPRELNTPQKDQRGQNLTTEPKFQKRIEAGAGALNGSTLGCIYYQALFNMAMTRYFNLATQTVSVKVAKNDSQAELTCSKG